MFVNIISDYIKQLQHYNF
jgi:hypothetical protein